MKPKVNALSSRYAAALKKHLRQKPRAGLKTARGLGCRAASMGLETLDVARIHERALEKLEAGSSRDGVLERAGEFFAETITPIEETHRAALKASARLKRLSKALDRRTLALAGANRLLKLGIARRRSAEEALKKSGKYYRTLLEESLALQKHLQHLTHQILSAQEHKRKQISHDLQDEIAQTLLGINVRLLTVKEAAGHNAKQLQEEIARTGRLVDRSVRTIERFTSEYGRCHES
ncbi:MAG TPA: histidine kinase [Verrucomicrobiae bacterium]|nr:histidine kinase [Verrucomicrobiae bacterium]